MKSNAGIEIESVAKGSIAEKAGLLPDDRLIAVNGNKIRDAIDLMFYSNEQDLYFSISRKGTKLLLTTQRGYRDTAGIGIALKPFHTRACRNNCIFCFVSQLPKGLRRPLYVKDDDYRMSFLYGNYITLTNLSPLERERIIMQRLGPLYISVHSTNPAIRNKLLGVQDAAPVLKEIKFFAGSKIRMHTQIVLCPGYNDGKDLEQTISDLYHFYPYVQSIAVVPVGLTAHRKKAIRGVGKEEAVRALGTIHKFQNRFKRKHGEDIVYGADELYIKAGLEFPPLADYGELPQIENGVGMVPLFLYQTRKAKLPAASRQAGRFITFTGVSFYPYLAKFVGRLRKAGVDIEVMPVENTFFGPSITVAGLLTGRDVIKSLSGAIEEGDTLLIPDVVLRSEGDVFLDEVTVHDLSEVLGAPASVVASTPQGIIEAVSV